MRRSARPQGREPAAAEGSAGVWLWGRGRGRGWAFADRGGVGRGNAGGEAGGAGGRARECGGGRGAGGGSRARCERARRRAFLKRCAGDPRAGGSQGFYRLRGQAVLEGNLAGGAGDCADSGSPA